MTSLTSPGLESRILFCPPPPTPPHPANSPAFLNGPQPQLKPSVSCWVLTSSTASSFSEFLAPRDSDLPLNLVSCALSPPPVLSSGSLGLFCAWRYVPVSYPLHKQAHSTQKHTRTHTCMLPQEDTHTRVHTRVSAGTYLHTSTEIYTYIYIFTQKPTWAHTDTHSAQRAPTPRS